MPLLDGRPGPKVVAVDMEGVWRMRCITVLAGVLLAASAHGEQVLTGQELDRLVQVLRLNGCSCEGAVDGRYLGTGAVGERTYRVSCNDHTVVYELVSKPSGELLVQEHCSGPLP